MANELVKKVRGMISGLDESVMEITEQLTEERKAVHEALESYQTGVLPANADEDTEKAWANDRTRISKERKGYDDIRKDVKNTWNGKVNPIISAFKDIDGEYAKAIANVDAQLETLDEKRKEEKTKAIKALYLSEFPTEFRERVSLDRILTMRDPAVTKPVKTYSETFMNKGYTSVKIMDLFRGMANSWQMSIDTIQGLNHKFEFDGIERFWETLDLNQAVAYMGEKQKQFDDFQRREAARIEYEKQQAIKRAQEEAGRQARIREAQIRQEEECKRREEEARIRAEEAAKAAEERRKQAEEEEKRRQAAVEVARAEERQKASEALAMDTEPEEKQEPKAEVERDGWATWNIPTPWTWNEQSKEKVFKYLVKVPESQKERFLYELANLGFNPVYIGEEEQ